MLFASGGAAFHQVKESGVIHAVDHLHVLRQVQTLRVVADRSSVKVASSGLDVHMKHPGIRNQRGIHNAGHGAGIMDWAGVRQPQPPERTVMAHHKGLQQLRNHTQGL